MHTFYIVFFVMLVLIIIADNFARGDTVGMVMAGFMLREGLNS